MTRQTPRFLYSFVLTLLLGSLLPGLAVAEPVAEAPLEQPAVVTNTMMAASADPMLLALAEGGNFRIIRYDLQGQPTTLLDRSFNDTSVVITSLAMGGTSLLAIGTNKGQIEVFTEQPDSWVYAYEVSYEIEQPPAITALAFGGTSYLAYGTSAGNFELRARPTGWDQQAPWDLLLSREFVSKGRVNCIAVNDSGWVLNGNEYGEGGLWIPGGEEGYQEAASLDYWDEFEDIGITAVSLGTAGHFAVGTEWGDVYLYSQNTDGKWDQAFSYYLDDFVSVTSIAVDRQGLVAAGTADGQVFLLKQGEQKKGIQVYAVTIGEEFPDVQTLQFLDGDQRLYARCYRFHTSLSLVNGSWTIENP
ncbi:MAG: hypothetical protein GEEBNDBF_00035 [bacterium]|nr:hypothetical protein [bacterium]